MFFTAVVAIGLLLSQTQSAEWDYKDFEAWNAISPRCADEIHQSPRSLQQDIAMIQDKCMNLEWFNDKARSFDISNNGHSLVFTPRLDDYEMEANRFYAAGHEWCMVQFHLHWSQDDHGAEHKLENFDNGLEVHFVHRRCDFATLAEAVAEDTNEINTIAVIGILYEVGPDDLMALLINSDTITTDLQMGNAQTVVYDFPYVEMLPPMDSRQFYSYQGSLTTPTCDPVLWFVVESQQKVSHLEMELLRGVEDVDGNLILSNQRPLQMNTEPLFYYEPCKATMPPKSMSDDSSSPVSKRSVKKNMKNSKNSKNKRSKSGKQKNNGKNGKRGKSQKNGKSSRRSGKNSRRSRWKN